MTITLTLSGTNSINIVHGHDHCLDMVHVTQQHEVSWNVG